MSYKRIVKNTITISIATVGFLGGLIWYYSSGWEIEPLILTIISLLEIIGYFAISFDDNAGDSSEKNKNVNTQKVEINITSDPDQKIDSSLNVPGHRDRSAIIESKKDKVGVLFIDDDTKFNVVKILKDSGWKKTKTVEDIKSLDLPVVRNSDIIFVDINGVGKILKLDHEGLDLALMLKQKYSDKKIVIYSANKNSNSFHQAWDVVDSRLEKNALPYQFQNLVENFSLEYYN